MQSTVNNNNALAAVLLSMLFVGGVPIVCYSATEEPFYTAGSVAEVFAQVGLSLVLCVLWIEWMAFVVLGCLRGSLSRLWVLAAPIALAWIAVLAWCARGYADDLVVGARGEIPR